MFVLIVPDYDFSMPEAVFSRRDLAQAFIDNENERRKRAHRPRYMADIFEVPYSPVDWGDLQRMRDLVE